MDSDRDTLAGGLPHSETPGSPIARISPGLFAACHVLHRLSVPRHPPDALSFALDHRHRRHRRCRTTAAHRAKPHALPPQAREAAASMKTLLGHIPGPYCRPRACPPRSHHNSLFTLQSTPAAVARGRSRNLRQTSPNPGQPPGGAGGTSRCSCAAPVDRQSFALPVVEVNGFEPMTSCLQSRRSPG